MSIKELKKAIENLHAESIKIKSDLEGDDLGSSISDDQEYGAWEDLQKVKEIVSLLGLATDVAEKL